MLCKCLSFNLIDRDVCVKINKYLDFLFLFLLLQRHQSMCSSKCVLESALESVELI